MTFLIHILDGNNFMVTDRRGDIENSLTFPTGLFSFDTRFLSTWVLTLNDERLYALSIDERSTFQTHYFLVPGEPTHYADAKLSVLRHRAIDGQLAETLTLLNHSSEEVVPTIRIEMASDFADLLDIKHDRLKVGETTVLTEERRLRLVYRRESFHRETVISVETEGDVTVDQNGMTFRPWVGPHGEWRARFSVRMHILGAYGKDFRESLPIEANRPAADVRQEREELIRQAPRLACDGEPLSTAYHVSLQDLAALRYHSITLGQPLLAAGLPWYMTLFGRDSMIAALQALPFLPTVIPPTLGVLAGLQGSRLDDFRDEEPGKILHELRYGESAGFEDQPHSPYYGSADSSPLFVILLDEYQRWTGDTKLVRRLEFAARAALDWIDSYADLLGNGYVWYQSRNSDTGLPNQCWKDSPESISYADGRLPGFPRAVCEHQGYAYDAKIRGARMARKFWRDPTLADRLEREAAALKERFNRDFWIADREYYALALDADGKQVDALASNMGHLLWSGIVPEDRAATVAAHLLGPRLFSGWGVRTLATEQGRYNPVGYHVGTVWPFDNSLIAWGLWRYGLREEAGRICQVLLDASKFFGGRLPEAFAGYDRRLTGYPVEYPTACSPQAWSAGTPLLLLRVMLGLEPHDEHLIIDPYVPAGLGRIELLNIPGAWGRVDALGRARTDHEPPLPGTDPGEASGPTGAVPTD
ncbi:amylo-alpha-1,6-glucosidase [Micromonospora sp. NBS 11-29]|uniref:amylo-alpha-1,6-glucosidase n=1 Tax=Micromonospora sp. NBS 11-29 TaxID=1960879 RepID=UPI000B76ED91|nr:glycogen debranching N-terminal domain-containing protein [Micromonospora sp. NBS 11-29]